MTEFLLAFVENTLFHIGPYLNEVVALTLFTVGFLLFHSVNTDDLSQEKLKIQIDENEKKAVHANELQTDIAEIKEVVEKKPPAITVHQYNIYIRNNYQHQPNLNPVQVIEQMLSEEVIPDITTYNTLLNICLEQNNNDSALSLFRDMLNLRDVISYNIMLKALSKKLDEPTIERSSGPISLLSKVSTLLDEARTQKVTFNEITYNILIDIYMKAGHITLALDTFDEMIGPRGLKADVYTYTTLIKGIKKGENQIGHIKELNRIYEIIRKISEEKTIKFDEVLFNSLIDSSFKTGSCKRAISFYEEMLKHNLTCTSVTYSILIKGFGQYKNLPGALEIHSKMRAENFKVSEITFGCLIDACIKCDNLNKALELIESEKEVQINTVIYTTLIKGLIKERRFDDAFDLFEQKMINAEDANSRPNIITYNSILECAVQGEEFKRMRGIYSTLTSKNNEIEADLITHSTYLKGLFKENSTDEALSLYYKLKNEGKFKIDEVLFNSILDGLLKKKMYESALAVYSDMHATGIKLSNVTCSILIKIYTKMGKIDEALNLLAEIKRCNIRPGLIVFTCLIQACIKTKKVDACLRLYNEMLDLNIKGDTVFFNTLISGLSYNHSILEAARILQGCLEKGISLNRDVYDSVLRNLVNSLEQNASSLNDTTKHKMEIYLLKISNLLRTRSFEIDLPLYNRIAKVMYSDRLNRVIRRRSEENEMPCLGKFTNYFSGSTNPCIPKFFNRNKLH